MAGFYTDTVLTAGFKKSTILLHNKNRPEAFQLFKNLYPMDITYTIADISHIAVIIDFRIRFLLDFGGPQPIAIQDKLREELHHYFSKHIRDNSYISCFASCNGTVVGAGGMKVIEYPGGFKNLQGTRGYIMNMYTKPEFRKRGICNTILSQLMEKAHTMGIHSFELHATKEGEPVYVKHGFEKHNEPTYRKWDKAYYK